jgi:hypothetical protein
LKLAAVFLALIPLAYGGMEKVWEIQLGDFVKEPAGWAEDKNHPITALAFSPDGKRLAIEIQHFRNKVASTHLAIVGVQSPNQALRQYDLATGPGPQGRAGPALAWSPNGTAIIIGQTLLRLADGTSCEVFPWPTRFVNRVLISLASWVDSLHVIRNDGAVLDLECKETGHWTIDGKWSVAGTEPTKGWVLLGRVVSRYAVEHAIADYAARVLLDGSDPLVTSGEFGPVFIDQGTAWCFYEAEGKGRSHCWKLRDGEPRTLPKALLHYELTQAGGSSSHVLAELAGHPFSNYFRLEDFDWYTERRVVWDFRSGISSRHGKPVTSLIAPRFRQTGNSSPRAVMVSFVSTASHLRIEQPQTRNILEVRRIQSPNLTLMTDRTCGDGNVNFARSRPAHGAVQFRRQLGIGSLEWNRRFTGERLFLSLQLLNVSRAARPFICDDRAKDQPLTVIHHM